VIVVDSSAIIAILQDEPESAAFLDRLLEAERSVLSAATWFEASMVWQGKQEDVGQSATFDELIDELGFEIVPLTAEHARIARDAFKRYGKGRGPARGEAGKHPKLNFGDCFAYALAKALDAPLLFKGGDFALTDVKRA
jgi:ribonuclease VapC